MESKRESLSAYWLRSRGTAPTQKSPLRRLRKMLSRSGGKSTLVISFTVWSLIIYLIVLALVLSMSSGVMSLLLVAFPVKKEENKCLLSREPAF